MYKKKQVSVNSTGHDLDASFDFHMEKTEICSTEKTVTLTEYQQMS